MKEVTWKQLNDLALFLSEAGLQVTAIHFAGQAPGTFEYRDAEAAIHSNADESYVRTSDGEKHVP